MLGAASVICGFVVIGVAGIMAVLRAPDRFGMLLAVGITTWVVVQALLNMGAVMAVLPVMGDPAVPVVWWLFDGGDPRRDGRADERRPSRHGDTKAHAIIAGGGTAGHVVFGLAIASELVARGAPPEQVHHVGSARGIETRLVPEAGFPLTVLPGRGIQRRLTLENVRSVFALLAAIVAGIRLVRRLRPAVVLGSVVTPLFRV